MVEEDDESDEEGGEGAGTVGGWAKSSSHLHGQLEAAWVARHIHMHEGYIKHTFGRRRSRRVS